VSASTDEKALLGEPWSVLSRDEVTGIYVTGGTSRPPVVEDLVTGASEPGCTQANPTAVRAVGADAGEVASQQSNKVDWGAEIGTTVVLGLILLLKLGYFF